MIKLCQTRASRGPRDYANGTNFSIDLKQVHTWGTGLHFSIQCNNSQWYGFYRWIDRPGYGVYFNVGRV